MNAKLSGHTTAIHEAGHAVIGRILDLRCGGVTIVKNEAEGEAGHAIIANPWATVIAWEQRLYEQVEHRGEAAKYRNFRSAFRGTIMARMAGAEAENVILGACQGGDSYDRSDIEQMAASSDTEFSEAEWERFEPRMRRQTRRLIRKYRAAIERVAAALLERGTLEPDDIDALIAPS